MNKVKNYRFCQKVNFLSCELVTLFIVQIGFLSLSVVGRFSVIGFITPPILDLLLLQYWIHYSSNIGFITPPILDSLLLQYRIYYSSNIGFITPPISDSLLLQYWIYYSSNIGFITPPILDLSIQRSKLLSW